MKGWERLAKVYRYITGRAEVSFHIDEFHPQALAERQLHTVILVRWTILEVLVIYGFFSYFFTYPGLKPLQAARGHGLVIAVVILVGLFNTFLHLFYRRLVGKRVVTAGQLLVDLMGVSIWVHYTGGSESWFWVLYMLVTLEAAFLVEGRGIALLVSIVGALFYAGILALGYTKFLLPAKPFGHAGAEPSISYLVANWGWVFYINVCVALMGAYFVGMVRERGRLLSRLAMRDGLTGLYDSGYFFRRLKGELERSKRFNHPASVLMLDVDHLKTINDTLGHLAGNRLLQMVARICRKNIRTGREEGADIDIACRFGGDEFAIILPEIDRENALGVARRIRTEVMHQMERFLKVEMGPKEKQEALLPRGMGISIGVAVFPKDGEEPEKLVHAADSALYQAKTQPEGIATARGKDTSFPVNNLPGPDSREPH